MIFDRLRHRHEIDADEPGAPPGFLLDVEDRRVGACTAHEPTPDVDRDDDEKEQQR